MPPLRKDGFIPNLLLILQSIYALSLYSVLLVPRKRQLYVFFDATAFTRPYQIVRRENCHRWRSCY
jgi:hypothetical protein